MAALTILDYAPWTDRNGRFSALRLFVFAFALLPAAWMALKWNMGWLSPKPVTDILRESGDWAMRFVTLVLFITPFRNAARWNRIIAVRRMLGLFTMFYVCIHLSLYAIDQQFVIWRIALELVLRTYLTIGAIAVAIFIALALTSTDAAVRRLGAERWNRRHRLIYVAAGLAILHFFMQVRLKAWEPSLIAGFLVLLGGYRLLRRYRGNLEVGPSLLLAVFAALLSALIEAGYYTYSMNAPFFVVLRSNLDFSYEIRPAWYVLAAGILFSAIIPARQWGGRFRISFPLFLKKTETARHR